MKNKFIIVLLLAFSLLATSCQSNQQLKDTSTSTFCEKKLEEGADLNKIGCMYKELDDAQPATFFVPDGSLQMTTFADVTENKSEDYVQWVHVVPVKTMVSNENTDLAYYLSVLESLLFDGEVKIDYDVDGNVITVYVTSDMVQKFAEEKSLISADEPTDDYGIMQVIIHSIGATIYSNFPEYTDVIFSTLGLEKITPIGDGYLVDPETLLPMFFGSPANYIGETSYEDFKEELTSQGIKFDNYAESHHLYMINGFVYDSFSN